MDDYLKDFVQESEENITELNNALLDLEDDPGDEDAVDRIFRTAHTLKGNAGAMGFSGASDLAHALEDLLDDVRAGRVGVTAQMMDEVFDAVDLLEEMVGEVREHDAPQTDPTERIESLRETIESAPAPDEIVLEEPSDDAVREAMAGIDAPAIPGQNVYHVRLEVSEEDVGVEGMLVLEALADAFDVLGTTPSEDVIRHGDHGDVFDAIISSAIGIDDIRAALEAVDQVQGVIVTDATQFVFEGEPDEGGEAVEYDDLDVDELLDEVSEFDDIDALAEEMADEELLDELDDAGSFDDVEFEPEDAEEEIEVDELLEGVPEVDAEAADEEAEADADADAEADDETPTHEEGEHIPSQDSNAVFKELQEEVDEVGFDELEEELAEVEAELEEGDESVSFESLLEEEPEPDVSEADLDAFDSEFDEGDDGLDEAVGDLDAAGEAAAGEAEAGEAAADEADIEGSVADMDADIPDMEEAVTDLDDDIPDFDEVAAEVEAEQEAEGVEAEETPTSEFEELVESGSEDELQDEFDRILDEMGIDDSSIAEPGRPRQAESADVGTSTDSEFDELEFEDLVDEVEGEEEPAEPEPQAGRRTLEEIESIRVDVEQVDTLLSHVEALVTNRIRLRQTIESGNLETALAQLTELEKITGRMQDTVMEVRLVPMGQIVGKLPRVVRDVAREQGKQVDFEVTGEDVELDRRILNQIGDPLLHLVRNAVDHGIESPEEREALGKPETGTVSVTARRTRDRVTIEVSDDGRGLDPDDIRMQAVREGIVTREEAVEMSEEEAYELIFHPGFSTAEEVTDVSGRGVGMDVVKSTVQGLDGALHVESEPEVGTTISLRVPVSVAIVRVLFVESGGEQYGIPIKNISEIGRMTALETVEGEEVLTHDDRVYPLIRLGEALETPGPHANGDGMLIRVSDEVRQVALHCDDVVRQEEVVVKPFEGLLSGIPGLSGATVLGEGDVVTILDVETL